MPLSGKLTFPTPNGSCPTGCWDIIGEDGNHYVVAIGQTGIDSETSVGCAETKVVTAVITNAQWVTDLSTVGFTGLSGTYSIHVSQGGIPIPGTSMFYLSGSNDNGTQQAFIRYKLINDTTLSVDGGLLYDNSPEFPHSGTHPASYDYWMYPCWCWGANVIGGELYALCWFGAWAFSDGYVRLLKLPISGIVEDLTTGIWRSQFVDVMAFNNAIFTNSGRNYYNRVSIFPDPAGIGILSYVGNGEAVGALAANSGSQYWVVDPVSMTLVVNGADARADFGQPWADEKINFVGGAGTILDAYCAASANAVTGGTELIFGRTYSDAPTQMHFRRFLKDSLTGVISDLDAVSGNLSGSPPNVPTIAVGMVFSPLEGNTILATLTEDGEKWYFGEVSVPAPTPTSSTSTTSGFYFIERMDNRIWPDIEAAWCLDAALFYPMPTPAGTLGISSATGDHGIGAYNLINGGSGYTAPVGQIIDLEGLGTGATVTLAAVSGVITSAVPNATGSGYIRPQLTILDATGSGAAVQPVVTNYVTLSCTTSSFSASNVGDIIRAGGGRIEVIYYGTTASTTTSVMGNVIAPITRTVPNDPANTPVPVTSGNWTMTTPTTSVRGLDHLEGMTASALADGGVVNNLTVTNGAVTLPYSASQILVGLPFTCQLQTMYMESPGGATIQSRRKNITQVTVRVDSSRAPEIGTNQLDAAAQPNQANIPWAGMTQIVTRTPAVPAGMPIPLVSGDLPISNVFTSWAEPGQIALQQRDPVPLTVLAVVPWVTVGDTPG